jgi:hypothetical protein
MFDGVVADSAAATSAKGYSSATGCERNLGTEQCVQ